MCVCVCMYVCMYVVCMYVCMYYICMYVCTYEVVNESFVHEVHRCVMMLALTKMDSNCHVH